MDLETLKITAPLSSKTSQDSYPTTQRYIPDDWSPWWEPVWSK